MIQPMMNNAPSLINSTTTPAGSISPYSGHSSLSPAPSHHADNIKKCGVIMGSEGQFIKTDNNSFQHALMMNNNDASHYDNIILKQEVMDDEGMFDESSLSNENMIDAIQFSQWWEQDQQQNLNQNSSP
jgi:hypothetical protein